KRISELRAGLESIVAVDVDKHLHLLLSSEGLAIPSVLKNFGIPKLSCEVRAWDVGDGTRDFLDLQCEAPPDNDYYDPFRGFCEDLLDRLQSSNTDVTRCVVETLRRHKRFWRPSAAGEVTVPWLRGLFGELLVLGRLVEVAGGEAVATWKGPTGASKDFITKSLGIEVKTTSPSSWRVRVSSIEQLDASNLGALYVAVLSIEAGETGTSVVELVASIESRLSAEHQGLFWERLAFAGYRRHREAQYQQSFSLAEERWFAVDDQFPSLTADRCTPPLDSRVVDVSYFLELETVSHLDSVDPVMNGFVAGMIE
ncbi:MAG: PD-(D/E)XK motif protein, partial [Myxococcota bacterium]